MWAGSQSRQEIDEWRSGSPTICPSIRCDALELSVHREAGELTNQNCRIVDQRERHSRPPRADADRHWRTRRGRRAAGHHRPASRRWGSSLRALSPSANRPRSRHARGMRPGLMNSSKSLHQITVLLSRPPCHRARSGSVPHASQCPCTEGTRPRTGGTRNRLVHLLGVP